MSIDKSLTEYRPLLTVEEVIAARNAGEVVEWSALSENWQTDYGCASSTVATDLANGYRYRARPAGEEAEGDRATDQSALIRQVQLRDAEIEALRAEAVNQRAASAEELLRQIAKTEAAEDRAARLEEVLCDLESWMDGWVRASAAVGRIATDVKDAIDAARFAVSGGGGE